MTPPTNEERLKSAVQDIINAAQPVVPGRKMVNLVTIERILRANRVEVDR